MSGRLMAVLVAVGALAAAAAGQPTGGPVTVAEASGFTRTSTSAEVEAFARELAAASDRVRVSEIGTSGEGRPIPLIIVSDPPVSTPAEARRAVEREGKVVALLLGNIHAGECDAKEGLLMLARELAMGGERADAILKGVVVLVVPNYNPDGNDKMAAENRPGQVGPERMGTRSNAQGLDLNRDFVKLDAPETRALVRTLSAWDPHLFFDGHTTNGSKHRYIVTYDGPKHPAGDRRVIELARDRMMPEVSRRLREEEGLETAVYGNFARDHTRWTTFPDHPHYSTNYVGLRNRLAVLSESYAYATYQGRVEGTLAFARACLEWTAKNREEVRKVLADADVASIRAGRAPSPGDGVAVRTRVEAFEAPMVALGFGGEGESEARDYEVALENRFVATHSVTRASAYVVPAGREELVHALQRHGVTVRELREDVEVAVEAYRLTGVRRAGRAWEGRTITTLEAEVVAETRMLRAGSYVVPMAQALGSLAAYLLEPTSEYGLAAWGLVGEGLEEGAMYPVLRVPAPVSLFTGEPRKLPEDRRTGRLVTEETLRGRDRPNFNGDAVRGLRWLDAEHYRQVRETTEGPRPMRVHARSGRAEPLEEAPATRRDERAVAAALAALPSIGERDAGRIAQRGGTRSEDGTAFIFTHENDLYWCREDGTAAARLTSTPEEEELATFSPDGRFVAFVRENDLWVVDVQTQRERALTTGGHDLLRRGKADWVYFEEVFGRNWRCYWWSPDSTTIAFLEVDGSPVPEFVLVNDISPRQEVERTRFPKPGEPNPNVTIKVVTAAGGAVRDAELPGYDHGQYLVMRVVWQPDSSRFLAMVANRTQTWMDVLAFGPDGGPPTRLFRERTGAWVDVPTIRFLADGSMLALLERSGYQHVYHFGRDGELKKQLTDGPWEVRGISRVDEERGFLIITGTRDNAIGSDTYRVSLADGTITRLSGGDGTHSAEVNEDASLVIDTWSNRSTPTRVALRDGASGEVVRWIDTNPAHDIEEFRLGGVEHVQVETPDGFLLEASVVLPADLDPSKRYPVWFQTYAGPHAPTISDTWAGGRLNDHAFANTGIIVMRGDPRSASGKGAVSAWACYKQLGVSELEDIEHLIRWITQRPYVDPARVGIEGYSYGGFMAAFALTHSDLFAAGIAGAAVTDWADYDTIYTERYMLTPQENQEGYARTSVVAAAKNVNGRLLIMHGMLDDNVHMQNATKLIHALQEANKPFEMMYYPLARHGGWGRHFQDLRRDFIERTVGGPLPIEAPSEGSPEPERAGGRVGPGAP